jgi:hypothetical protein
MTDEQLPPAPPPMPAKAIYGRGTLAAVTIAVILYAGITVWKMITSGQGTGIPAETGAGTPRYDAPELAETSTFTAEKPASPATEAAAPGDGEQETGQ